MERKIKIDKSEFATESKSFEDCNILKCTVGTTGFMGGDSGHGGRTFFRLDDLWGTDMRVRFYEDGEFMDASGIAIAFGGDAELKTFIESLEFAVKTLRKQSGHTRWKCRRMEIKWFLRYELKCKIKHYLRKIFRYGNDNELPF